jgi:hypothetical protein
MLPDTVTAGRLVTGILGALMLNPFDTVLSVEAGKWSYS